MPNSLKFSVVCNLLNNLQKGGIKPECLVRVFETFNFTRTLFCSRTNRKCCCFISMYVLTKWFAFVFKTRMLFFSEISKAIYLDVALSACAPLKREQNCEHYFLLYKYFSNLPTLRVSEYTNSYYLSEWICITKEVEA